MTRTEFINKLQAYYKPEGDEVITRLNDWLQDRRLKDSILDDFFNVITESHEHKYFPNIPQLKDYLKIYYASRTIRSVESMDKVDIYIHAVNKWHDLIRNETDIKQIIKWLQRAYKHNNDAMAISILSRWDSIYWEWRAMVSRKATEEEKVRHLNYVKDCIMSGTRFDAVPNDNVIEALENNVEYLRVEGF